MINLLRYDKDQKYIVVDFETCNLNLGSLDNKPWQLGLLVCQGDNILERHNKFIKWDDLKLSVEAAKKTRFDMASYRSKAEDAAQCLDLLEKFLYNPDYYVLGHNYLNFDCYIHTIYRRCFGKAPDYSYITRVIDTNCLAKGIKLNFPYQRTQNLLSYQYQMQSKIAKGVKTNLTAMGEEYGIQFDYENVHDGIKDCELLWLVWSQMKYRVEI